MVTEAVFSKLASFIIMDKMQLFKIFPASYSINNVRNKGTENFTRLKDF